MTRFISNLKLLHKLAIPAVLFVAAALATLLLAFHWMTVFENNVSTIVDQHAARLEQTLTIIADLNEATLTQRDLRLASKVDLAEKLASEYRAKLQKIVVRLDGLMPLMTESDDRRILGEAKDAMTQFLGVGGEQSGQIIEALKTGTPPPSNGKGRVWRHKVDGALGQIEARARERMRVARDIGIKEGRRAAMLLVAVSGLAALVGLAILAWIAIVQVARPLGGMAALMSRLASGDLSVEVSGAKRRDEVGALARALLVFKQTAIDVERTRAERDAEHETKAARAQTLDRLTREFETKTEAVARSLSEAARKLQGSAQSMVGTADGASQQSTTVAAAAEEASTNVETVAAATEELAGSIRQIARQVTESASISSRAAE